MGHFLLSGNMSAQKLPAGTLEGREVWRSEGSCAFGAINLFFLGAREACSWSSWVVQSGLRTDVLITAVQFWL